MHGGATDPPIIQHQNVLFSAVFQSFRESKKGVFDLIFISFRVAWTVGKGRRMGKFCSNFACLGGTCNRTCQLAR